VPVAEGIPQHIAIIMDGNGRWAESKKLPRIAGHRRGAETVKTIVRACHDRGIRFLTLYTFSTENWKRPEPEINFLMQLLSVYLEQEIRNLSRNNIRFLTIGKIEELPQKVRVVIERAVDLTKKNSGLTLVLALNYGSRREIMDACLELARDLHSGNVVPAAVNEELFARYLYTANIPDPDLMIRTSGEMRLSNFLLWQLSYAELYVTQTLWPDFGESELDKALADFQARKRRFGGL
jgi:Undecaprenyl pyrophosphate synthetase (EC 2.5.1.31)